MYPIMQLLLMDNIYFTGLLIHTNVDEIHPPLIPILQTHGLDKVTCLNQYKALFQIIISLLRKVSNLILLRNLGFHIFH